LQHVIRNLRIGDVMNSNLSANNGTQTARRNLSVVGKPLLALPSAV